MWCTYLLERPDDLDAICRAPGILLLGLVPIAFPKSGSPLCHFFSLYFTAIVIYAEMRAIYDVLDVNISVPEAICRLPVPGNICVCTLTCILFMLY